MEKGNANRIISIAALVLAVIGLSVGFAAYSSTLNISANANVQVSGNEWNVGFADTSSAMASLTTPTVVSGSNSNGSLNMLKYTLSQGTAATLSNTSTSSVTYSFKIKNAGSINATLQSISSAGLTCAYDSNASSRVLEQDATPNTGKEVTAGSGTISPADCSTMFTATLTIHNIDYNLSNLPQSFSDSISAGSDVDATLTIAGTGNNGSAIPNGDFIVTLGATTVVYGS